MSSSSRPESNFAASRLLFWIYPLSIVTGVAILAYQSSGLPPAQPLPVAIDPTRLQLTLPLKRGDFTVLRFPSKLTPTKAIILFGSGDGGWRNDFEERVARGLQGQGFDVIGIDCAAYAKTDYDLPTLQADFTRIAQTAEAPFGGKPPPLIVGGYSMGAEQAIPAAGGPNPPPQVAGLLLISPVSRGRYGLRTMDKMDVPPTGPGTFALGDFDDNLKTLRVAQWHGAWDPTDSVAWLDQLHSPHQKLVYPDAWHNFRYACPDFLQKLGESATWVAGSTSASLANSPIAPAKGAN